MLSRDSEDEFEEGTLIKRTQPSGPLCLWQCFFQIPIIPISSQANPVDEQDSHNLEGRNEKKPEDAV